MMATRLIEVGSIDIEAIKDRHPLASIVEQYVALKRRSGLLEGLCPFHEERTPSFKIYEKDQRYHCFGCGAHGDVFDFLQAHEGLDLRDAAERITGGTFPTYSPERIEELRAKRAAFEADQQAQRDRAIIAARERWIAADPNFLTHPYLDRKRIDVHGTRLEGDKLLIPLIAEDGKIQTLQSIDPSGRKLFVSDAPVSGGLFVLGGKVASAEGPVIICEGFATAASIQEATGLVVVCAFNSGNLIKVATRLGEKYPAKDYIVAGDDDRGKDKNIGRAAAIDAAAILSCRAVFPVFANAAGTDFNDMAADYGCDAVRALIIDNVLPDGQDAPEDFGEVFETLSLDELEALPPPTWLIEEVVTEHGLTIVYGDPGAGKSFIVLDAALRLSFGMDWHGVGTQQCGVLYVAGEGARGLGKRVKGWRREHALEGADAPFELLPVAVQLLDEKERAKLLRTIRATTSRLKFKVGLLIIDTVSRSIAGHDENSQDTMSLFVNACAEIQAHIGGAVIGVHHSGKDSSRGMRGSTVLLGACDASIKVSKDESERVKIEVEKQKDAEEAEPIYMAMKKVEWVDGVFGKEVSTLVPEKSGRPVIEERRISKQQAVDIFYEIDRAWNEQNPWSVSHQAKRRGRYLPDWIALEYEVSAETAVGYLTGWQQREYLKTETVPNRNQTTGLRVLKHLEADQ